MIPYKLEKKCFAPDWDEWQGIPVINLKEAVYLSVNVNPDAKQGDMELSDWEKINSRLNKSFKNLKPMGGELELYDEYDFFSGEQHIYSDFEDETDIFVLCKNNKVRVEVFGVWATSKMGWDLPEEFPYDGTDSQLLAKERKITNIYDLPCMSPTHVNYSSALEAAIAVWAMVLNKADLEDEKTTAKKLVIDWLKENRKKLSGNVMEEIARLVNPDTRKGQGRRKQQT